MAILIVVVIMVIPQGVGVLLLDLGRRVFRGRAT